MAKTVGGSWIRVTAPTAEQIKDAIYGIIGEKSDAIKNHQDLRYNINLKYAEIVKPYVPYSGLNKTHHLNDAYVTHDGRIIWTAVSSYTKKNSDDGSEDNETNTYKYNYAMIQYSNPVFKHPSRYEGHEPRYRWTDALQPDTDAWEYRFIPAIKPLITEEFRNA